MTKIYITLRIGESTLKSLTLCVNLPYCSLRCAAILALTFLVYIHLSSRDRAFFVLLLKHPNFSVSFYLSLRKKFVILFVFASGVLAV